MEPISRVRGFALAGVALTGIAFAAENGLSPIRFEELAAKAGVRTEHRTRRYEGKKGDVLRMFTSGGAAAATGDFDNDGFDDLFVTDSDRGRPNFLYRNLGNGKFEEVAAKAGVQGGNDENSIVADAVFFDYDNDGWQDLLVARFGTPLLYHNEKDGTFKNVSAAAGFTQRGNSIAVLAFDYDNDGFLDVMFGHYFKNVNLLKLEDPHVLPNDLDNAVNGGGVSLYRNNGKGAFVDSTAKGGFSQHTGWTLDIGHGDLNNDGYQDVYLANDYGTDRMYFNNRKGTFTEVTEKAMGGFDTKKGMNAEIADYHNDGWLDVYVTNITDEYMRECNMLWHNNGDGTFTDLSKETGTCETLWGWAAKFMDFDNDGWQDLFVVNGLRSAGKGNYIPVLLPMITTPGIDFTDVNNWPEIGDLSWSGYQKKKMYRNLGGDAFREISADAGTDNNLDGRGLAMLDYDNDGRVDIYQANADQPSLLYRNTTANPGNWVQLKLTGTKSNRDATGARVVLKAGGKTQLREVSGGNGYAGQSMSRLHYGIGAAAEVESVEIRWPSGVVEKLKVPINKLTRITEGKRPAAK